MNCQLVPVGRISHEKVAVVCTLSHELSLLLYTISHELSVLSASLMNWLVWQFQSHSFITS